MGRAMVEAFAALGDLIVAVDVNGWASETLGSSTRVATPSV
jgi:NAD(P)-dependent dehydrogenase (short-subunit alcohol dehydrogenase family)